MNPTIRIMTPDDAEACALLRREMLLDSPSAFASSPEDDMGSDAGIVKERLAMGPDNVVIGAWSPELVGSVGIYRESKLKIRHRLSIWGMYVAPAFRNRGLGTALVKAAIAHGRQLDAVVQIHLEVNENAGAAQSLYEALGFRVWGTEPSALYVDGKYWAEHHMVLVL